MNNIDLAARLADPNGISKADARALVEGVFAAIAEVAAAGEEIALNGSGKFKVKASPAGEGRNASCRRLGMHQVDVWWNRRAGTSVS